MNRPTLLGVVALVCALMLLATGAAVAQDRVNFQGRLTGNDGLSVPNGIYTLHFRIYDDSTGGTILWDETHLAQVNNGQFNVALGETNGLDPSDFGPDGRFLEVQVEGGATAETLLPRTRLASVPRAGLASRISGDIQTAQGTISMQNAVGNASLLLGMPQGMTGGADSGQLVFYRQGTQSMEKSLELQSQPLGSVIRLFDPATDPPGDPTMELSAGFENKASMVIFDPQPEPPGRLFELFGDPVSGAHMSFGDQIGEVMGVEPSPFNGGFKLNMFDPSSGSAEAIGEIASTYQSGGAKGVATADANAVGGSFSIRAFDPQPEPPGKLFELLAQYGSSSSSSLQLRGAQVGASNRALVKADADIGGGSLRIGPAADATIAGAVISLGSNSIESRLQVEGPPTLALAPPVALLSTASAAKVGIGTASPSEALHVVGNIVYTGTIGAISDEKYKKDVAPLDHALDAVSHMRGVRYSWRTDQYPGLHLSSRPQIGFIAQDVKSVAPEVVTELDDGTYTVDYSRMTPLLLEAVKELRTIVDAQQLQIESLQRQLEAQHR